jgi:hypothetical protein
MNTFTSKGEGVDPYIGGSDFQNLRSFSLIHKKTGRSLDLHIEIENIVWSHTEIKLKFIGETSEIQSFKEALEPVLKDRMWKYKH